tara:strand:+ start:944 stop:1261 length:318 start_codon:yes stop_codon:yes gene_type:complete
MSKFTSIITLTLPSEPAYKEFYKINDDFFFKDKKVLDFLKQNGMTKWTMSKTDELEPIKLILSMEYLNKKSFDRCQALFLKFMPKVRHLIFKSNILRGEVIFDKV